MPSGARTHFGRPGAQSARENGRPYGGLRSYNSPNAAEAVDSNLREKAISWHVGFSEPDCSLPLSLPLSKGLGTGQSKSVRRENVRMKLAELIGVAKKKC